MKTRKFMNVPLDSVKKLIENKLPNEFDSHDFIQIFSKDYESAYIEILNKYKKNSIRTTHSQIAINLRKNMEELNIKKNIEIKSDSIFGNNVPNKKWIKTN